MVKTGAAKTLVIQNTPSKLTQAEIDERLAQLKNLKVHPRERAENRLLMARGERIFEESLGSERNYIAALLNRFESALYSQNETKTKDAAEKFKTALDEFEGRYSF